MDEGKYQEELLRSHRLMHIRDDMVKEMERAEKKHPVWPADRLRQTAILVEEAGEALQATLNLIEYLDREQPDEAAVAALESALESEVISTGAMAIRWLYARREARHDSQGTA